MTFYPKTQFELIVHAKKLLSFSRSLTHSLITITLLFLKQKHIRIKQSFFQDPSDRFLPCFRKKKILRNYPSMTGWKRVRTIFRCTRGDEEVKIFRKPRLITRRISARFFRSLVHSGTECIERRRARERGASGESLVNVFPSRVQCFVRALSFVL